MSTDNVQDVWIINEPISVDLIEETIKVEQTQSSLDQMRDSVISALDTYYQSYVIETVDESIQVFQTLTYGEMLISLLLLCLLFLHTFRWIWEVLR